MPAVFIPGSCGRIEARHHVADKAVAPMALVLHPNPQFGGSMNTLLVYTLFTVFQDMGCHVLRFNYRGVGRSVGDFVADTRIVEDAAAVWAWMREQHPESAGTWIAGFSLGAWIGLQLGGRLQGLDGCIAVAPPVNKLDFSSIEPLTVPHLVIHGTEDALVPQLDVQRFVERRAGAGGLDWTLRFVNGASHFFENQQEEVACVASQWLAPRLKHA